jgi:hypothetical protein
MTNPSRYEQGRPDYHDSLAGVGGAPPAQSALTLRLVLASFGLIAGVVGAIVFLILGPIWFGVLFAVVALTALIDIIVVVRGRPAASQGDARSGTCRPLVEGKLQRVAVRDGAELVIEQDPEKA